MRFLLAFGLLLLNALEHLPNGSGLVALEGDDVGYGFVTHAGKLMKQYGEKRSVTRDADFCHVVTVSNWFRTEVANSLSEFLPFCGEDAFQLFAISGRHFDGLGVDNAISRLIDSCSAQSEQRFADANTSISADAVPHLQLFDICHCYLFFVNNVCFPSSHRCKGKQIANKEAALAQ